MIHCTAGKDRTGFGAALILHALGVSDDVIDEDYLLTNRYYKRDPGGSLDRSARGGARGARQGGGLVPRRRARRCPRANYGSLDGYLSDGLGVGPRERKELEASIWTKIAAARTVLRASSR